MLRDNIILIPYHGDPLDLLAQHLLNDFEQQLPDLTQAVILLSEPHAAKRLRQLLLQQAEQKNINALLCPKISNIQDWSKQQFNQLQLKEKICSQHHRELILFDALSQHGALLGSSSPWHLTDDLLDLFDQLTLNKNTLPDDYNSFEKQIAEAYGVSANEFSALGNEASLVYTLWNAWHTQMNAESSIDNAAAQLLGLNADLKNNNHFLYIAGYHQFSIAEQNWINQLLKDKRCQLYLHGQSDINVESDTAAYHPDIPIDNLLRIFNVKNNIETKNSYSRFLDNCYDYGKTPFTKRSLNQSEIANDDIRKQLKFLFCQSHEQQAHAVELQVRRWLLKGKRNIGIVTENRRLARRVRALLERAEVPLQDLAGWALSTTRAGAVIESWLTCIEEDFPYLPFLDLLKSPFVFKQLDARQTKQSVYRLEQDIIRQGNISRNLSSYKKSIHARESKLGWSSETSETLIQMLEICESASVPLISLLKGSHSASDYITALTSSLNTLGMTQLLQQDSAGMRIIEMLETLNYSAQQYELEFSWSDFRTWLGRNLEKFVFVAEKNSSPVTLLGLGQSRLQKFDALIIASAEHEHLPGTINVSAFFNNNVRMQLKLNTTHDYLVERFHHFRRLLESSPEILITANNEENGNEIALSPWLEIIHRFYQQSYSNSLEDEELKSLVLNPNTLVIRCKEKSLPNKTVQAKTALPKHLIPKKYSPSSYQSLMDCPYQFFAANALKLNVNEEVQEVLSKSDFGKRIHRCLQAFHQEMEGYTLPFNEIITEKNRNSAIDTLNSISKQVFAKDLTDNYEHSGWLQQWLKLIPDYINWQIGNAEQWKFDQAEINCKLAWKEKIELRGRLDRVDKSKTGLSIIDYKTGKSAKLSDIENGEAVQLPFYGLIAAAELNQPVQQVSYLSLDKSVKTAAILQGDALDTITQQISERLEILIQEMQQGKILTAWGDDKTCKVCKFDRLCRKQAWNN